jgi:hypothetical protein
MESQSKAVWDSFSTKLKHNKQKLPGQRVLLLIDIKNMFNEISRDDACRLQLLVDLYSTILLTVDSSAQ